MIDYNLKKINQAVSSENYDWNDEKTYKGNARFFTDEVIKDYLPKIKQKYLFKHKKLSKDIRTMFFNRVVEVIKKETNYLLSKDSHYNNFPDAIKDLTEFFAHQIAEEDELCYYMKTLKEFENIFQKHGWYLSQVISTKQKFTQKVLEYMRENNIITDNDYYSKYKRPKIYFGIQEREFIIWQSRHTKDLVITDPIFSPLIFSKESSFLRNVFLRYCNMSKEVLLRFLDEYNSPEIYEQLARNRQIVLDDELAKRITNEYIKMIANKSVSNKKIKQIMMNGF